MATNQGGIIKGDNFEVSNGSANFFGAIGQIISEKSWAINGFGGDLLVEVSPDSMMGTIRECIETDVQNGNVDKLAQLVLMPRQAVVLYLEGVLTKGHFKNATETDQEILIPDVQIDEYLLTVRIVEESDYEVYTADSNGELLPDSYSENI